MPFQPSSKLGFVAEFAWAWLATAILSIWISVRGRGFDLIHACNPPDTYWLLARLWQLRGKRFVFDHHDLSPDMYQAKFGDAESLWHKLLLIHERLSYATADVALATNESHKVIAIDRGRMKPEDIFIVRSGPDLARFRTYAPDPEWKQGKEHLITYLGDISPQDGVDGLVRIVRLLSQMRDDFHVVVVGGGSALNEVRAYAASEGVNLLFTFTGVVSDETLCRVLSSASVAVDTVPKSSWSDKSTMNKIVEYMFFGLPIVSYDLAETRYSAQTAVVTEVTGQESEFATIISSLLDDPERRARIGRAGQLRLQKQLSWEHSVPSLLAAYDRALAQPRRKDFVKK